MNIFDKVLVVYIMLVSRLGTMEEIPLLGNDKIKEFLIFLTGRYPLRNLFKNA